MPLGAGWWATDWADHCIPTASTWGDATVMAAPLDDLWNFILVFYLPSLYQRDRAYGMAYDDDNGSMFYIRNKATGKLTAAAEIFRMPGQGSYASFAPSAESGEDIERFDTSMDVVYNSPFTPAPSVSESDYQVVVTNQPNAASGDTFEIVHHCAWAWHGYPSSVIAAMLLRLGVAAMTWLDTTAIDNAYDGEHNDHVAFPPLYAPRVRVAREVGKLITDTIKRVAAHSWTRIGYTMAGKFACWSATRPVEYAAAGLLGIKGRISSRMVEDHLYNTVTASYGQVSRSTIGGAGQPPTVVDAGVEVSNPDYIFKSEWDPTLGSAASDLWEHTEEDATSQTAYGVIPLNGNGERGEAVKLHFEYYADPYPIRSQLPRVTKFCQPLREITFEQDFHGLDYEVGTLITGYVCSDGATINMFCIEKIIDFETLNVTSKFLEDLA